MPRGLRVAPRGLPTWSSGASEIGARERRDSSRGSSRGSSKPSSRPRPWGGAWEDGPWEGCCWSAGSAGDATGPASYASMLLRNATHTVMSAAAAHDSSPLLLPPAPHYALARALVLFCSAQAVSVRYAGSAGRRRTAVREASLTHARHVVRQSALAPLLSLLRLSPRLARGL